VPGIVRSSRFRDGLAVCPPIEDAYRRIAKSCPSTGAGVPAQTSGCSVWPWHRCAGAGSIHSSRIRLAKIQRRTVRRASSVLSSKSGRSTAARDARRNFGSSAVKALW
jgi:hypothetical protein